MIWLQFLGGLALFMYGLRLSSEALPRFTGAGIKRLLPAVTKNRLCGAGVGFVLTLLSQSSSATTVMMVSFVNAAVIDLAQALSVVLGAAVGTTVIVQLIAFRVTRYALVLVVAGVLALVAARRRRSRAGGQALTGFGLLFYGLSLMVATAHGMAAFPAVGAGLAELNRQPLLALPLALAATALVQNSATVIALGMSFALHGELALAPSLALVLGANVGSTTAGLVSSLFASREAKRLALSYLVAKARGAAPFALLLGPYVRVVELLSADPGRRIADAHTLFNLVNLCLFLPLIRPLAGCVAHLLPPGGEEEMVLRYLDDRLLDSPEVALDQARLEVLRLARLVQGGMVEQLSALVHAPGGPLTARLRHREQVVDFLYRSLNRFLADLGRGELTEEEAARQVNLLYVCHHLEHVGDQAIAVSRLLNKLGDAGVKLADADWDALDAMHRQVRGNLGEAIAAFAEGDEGRARAVVQGYPEVLHLERDLRYRLFAQLQQEGKLDLEGGTVLLDLLAALVQIGQYAVNIAQVVLGMI